MKRIFNVLVVTLALNFLAIAGGVGWLYQTGRLDRAKVLAVKDVLFPVPSEPSPPAAPAPDPANEPILRLEELLANATGRSAAEQVQFIQNTFDAKMAQLERRERELSDLHRQIELAREQLVRDRGSLEKRRSEVVFQQEQTTRLASDKGFQDSLQLYNSMPGRQVKRIFMTLDDETVVNYLQAMPPRNAARIIKEFKTPDELARIQTIMEEMRQADVQAQAKE